MQICKLSIQSEVDGRKSVVNRMGRWKKDGESVFLYYKEENAEVRLLLTDNTAKIDRTGDYALSLLLIQGEKREGTLGIAGSTGKIWAHAKLVRYTETEEKIEIALQYNLLFSGETQKMRLKIVAQRKGGKSGDEKE